MQVPSHEFCCCAGKRINRPFAAFGHVCEETRCKATSLKSSSLANARAARNGVAWILKNATLNSGNTSGYPANRLRQIEEITPKVRAKSGSCDHHYSLAEWSRHPNYSHSACLSLQRAPNGAQEKMFSPRTDRFLAHPCLPVMVSAAQRRRTFFVAFSN